MSSIHRILVPLCGHPHVDPSTVQHPTVPSLSTTVLPVPPQQPHSLLHLCCDTTGDEDLVVPRPNDPQLETQTLLERRAAMGSSHPGDAQCHPNTHSPSGPGVSAGKSCLCSSNIGLLFCICSFFKDTAQPLPRFLRRSPQQCRPRSPPNSKKTNVRPRIDMK